jgi:hypothetical protein
MADDWVTDCRAAHGRVLTGNSAHWCPDWDFLPIDETVIEFESCACFPRGERSDQMERDRA